MTLRADGSKSPTCLQVTAASQWSKLFMAQIAKTMSHKGKTNMNSTIKHVLRKKMRPTFNNFYIEWITILMVLCSTAAPIEIPPPQEIALQETMDHLHLNRSFLPKNLPKSNKVLSGIPIPTGIPLPTFSPITLTETSTRSFLDELNLVNINNNKQLSVQNQGSTANFNPPSQSGQSSGTGYGSYGSGNVLGQPSVPVFNQQPTSGNFGNGPSTFNNGQNFQGQSSTGFGMSTGNNQQQQSGYGANTGNIQQQQPQQQQQQQQQQQLQQPIQSSGYSGGANFGGPSIPMGQFGQSFSPSPASNPQLGTS
ncbi:hypothetical protein RvY_10601 [Ramazzottius varieornatus]|uniref:Uncharacterized protein n=1 Tax=Ramazzottius varieornatus TaxID=947166 RepID=A0A1D1VL40_RAMVA|nr:hypothetical protein RvY_10601 [Ramazzottius varieornatus]